MSRMMLKAAALASLVAGSLAGSSAQAQGFGPRFPSDFRGPSAYTQRPAPGGFPNANPLYRTVDHRDLTLPGHGGFPGNPGPIGPIGGGRGDFAPPAHRGFPGGSFPPAQGYGPGYQVPTAPAACPPGVPPVIGAVDALIEQVGAFLQVFGPTAHCVPQGDAIYRDALALYESAASFRQAALGGAPPQTLLGIYAAMDNACCQLVSRVDRVSRGRTGPNIEQVRLIGALCNQIRSMI